MKNPIRAALQRGETVTGLILFSGSPMITELAAAAGQDSYQFRRARLTNPRWIAVLDAAAQLGIGYYTADEYIRSVYVKLQVRSRGSAIATAVKEGLV